MMKKLVLPSFTDKSRMPPKVDKSEYNVIISRSKQKSENSNNYPKIQNGNDNCPETLTDEVNRVDKANHFKLKCALVICLVFFFIELLSGFMTHSLAILSDSFHLLSDAAGFLVSLVAHHLSRRPATTKHSYGFYRIEVLGALCSTFIIWAMTGILVWEAIQRISNPVYIDARLMFFTAVCALIVNIFTAIVLNLKHDHHLHHNNELNNHSHFSIDAHNINVQSAAAHVIGDIISSIGVIIASIVIYVNPNWVIIDPICTFLFSTLVIYFTYSILKNSLAVLMEATPVNIDSSLVYNDLLSIPGVKDVHDLHIWNLTLGKTSLSVHIHFVSKRGNDSRLLLNEHNEHSEDTFEKEFTRILSSAQNLVCSKYGIHHATIQLENDDFQLTDRSQLSQESSPLNLVNDLNSSSSLNLTSDDKLPLSNKSRQFQRYRAHCDNSMCRTNVRKFTPL